MSSIWHVSERYGSNYEVIIRIDRLVWVLLSPDRHCRGQSCWVLFKETNSKWF